MDGTTLTTSINSLIILSSATLTISSYLHNNIRSQFSDGQARLRHEFFELGQKAGHDIEEENRKDFDHFDHAHVDGVRKFLYWLFGIVIACGILTAANFVAGYWLPDNSQIQHLADEIIVFFLVVSGLLIAVLIPAVGASLIAGANRTRQLQDLVYKFQMLCRVAAAARANHHP